MPKQQNEPSYGYYALNSTILLLVATVIGIVMIFVDLYYLQWEWMNIRWLFWFGVATTIFNGYHSISHILGVHLRLKKNNWIDMDFIVKYAQLMGEEHILDIGCGTGRFSIPLAKHLTTGRLVGIDIFSTSAITGNSLQRVTHNTLIEGVMDKCEFRFGNALDIPFPDNTFDVVSAGSVLHVFQRGHLRAKVVQEIFRVLKPGGKFITIEWDRNTRNALVFGVFILIFFYPRKYWFSLFKNTNFSNIRATTFGPKKMTLYVMEKPSV